MKVLFIVRSTLFTNKGGDTIQVQKTAEYLRKEGIDITIRLTNETIDYRPYQLLHLFNITRPADILVHIRKSAKHYVLSPIFVEYEEYDSQVRKGASGMMMRFLPVNMIEYVKVIARAIVNKEKIMSKEYILYGQKKAIRKILSRAALLLPNSVNEYHRLYERFGIRKDFQVIPNAVDGIFLQQPGVKSNREKNLVICVARIEGLKNQLNLIRALNNTRYKLLLIGNPALNQLNYFNTCKKEAGSNIQFISYVPQQELVTYYQRASVHVLPSWFETTGLSSLEAAAMGCSIVITNKGDTHEYFGQYATYCDPSSPKSIFEAIEAATVKDSEPLKVRIAAAYTWKHAAEKTAAAYRQVVKV